MLITWKIKILFISGPFISNYKYIIEETCEQMWKTTLYIDLFNSNRGEKVCYASGWYLTMDFYFHLLSLILLSIYAFNSLLSI